MLSSKCNVVWQDKKKEKKGGWSLKPKSKVEKQIIMFSIRDPFQFQDLISTREKTSYI